MRWHMVILLFTQNTVLAYEVIEFQVVCKYLHVVIYVVFGLSVLTICGERWALKGWENL